MKNWKTTLIGLITGLIPAIDALITAYNSGYFTGKTGGQLILGIGIILFGALAKDYNVSSSKPRNTTADSGNDPIVGDRPGDR
ncbi:hypothetical protein [Flavobacterium phage FL-1]|nr:hypothetical protein [Flavobacterium phage FL-1]